MTATITNQLCGHGLERFCGYFLPNPPSLTDIIPGINFIYYHQGFSWTLGRLEASPLPSAPAKRPPFKGPATEAVHLLQRSPGSVVSVIVFDTYHGNICYGECLLCVTLNEASGTRTMPDPYSRILVKSFL